MYWSEFNYRCPELHFRLCATTDDDFSVQVPFTTRIDDWRQQRKFWRHVSL